MRSTVFIGFSLVSTNIFSQFQDCIFRDFEYKKIAIKSTKSWLKLLPSLNLRSSDFDGNLRFTVSFSPSDIAEYIYYRKQLKNEIDIRYKKYVRDSIKWYQDLKRTYEDISIRKQIINLKKEVLNTSLTLWKIDSAKYQNNYIDEINYYNSKKNIQSQKIDLLNYELYTNKLILIFNQKCKTNVY